MSAARFKTHHIIDTNIGDRIRVPSDLKRGGDKSVACINGFEDVLTERPQFFATPRLYNYQLTDRPTNSKLTNAKILALGLLNRLQNGLSCYT